MNKAKPVDIMQECTSLFNQEDTLAYFDFQFGADSGSPVEGLCRIAHPKKASGGKAYVSLVFVVDTPDPQSRGLALAGLKVLGSGLLEKMLPEISLVVSVPPAKCPAEIYIKQFDLMLKELFTASREFVGRRLYPALTEVLALRSGELGWWDDMKKEQPLASVPAAVEKQIPKSFIARLQEKLLRG